MTSATKFIFALVFFAMSNNALAQYVSVPMSVRTPGGTFNNTQHIYMPMNYARGGGTHYKYQFQVTLKTDSSFRVTSRMEAKDKKLYLEAKHKGKKFSIYPNDTRQITANMQGKIMRGIPADSCWLFQVTEGHINGYSTEPIRDPNAIIAIQKEDGSIVSLNKKNLESMVDTSDESIRKWLDNGKLVKVIKRANKLSLK